MYSTPWKDPERMKHLVDEGLTQNEIAEKLGCAQSTVSLWIRLHGIDYQKKDELKGNHK